MVTSTRQEPLVVDEYLRQITDRAHLQLGQQHTHHGSVEDCEKEVLGTFRLEGEEQKMQDGEGAEDTKSRRHDRRVLPDQPESRCGEALHLPHRNLEALEVSLKDVARDVRVADGEKVVDPWLQRDGGNVLRQRRLLLLWIRRYRAESSHQMTVEVDLRGTGLRHMDTESVAKLLAGPDLASKPTDAMPSPGNGFGIA